MDETNDRTQRSLWNFFAVEQGFKQRQIMRLLFLSALNVLVSTGAFIAFFNYEVTSLNAGGLYASQGPSVLRIAIVWAALMSGLGGLFALMTGLMMTHRMAGPIHNFKNELKRIEAGETPRPIHLRDGDEFADVAIALNGALDTLWSRACTASQEGALALDLDSVRSVHVEILEGLEQFDFSALPEPERAQAESWRDRMRDLEMKLND